MGRGGRASRRRINGEGGRRGKEGVVWGVVCCEDAVRVVVWCRGGCGSCGGFVWCGGVVVVGSCRGAFVVVWGDAGMVIWCGEGCSMSIVRMCGGDADILVWGGCVVWGGCGSVCGGFVWCGGVVVCGGFVWCGGVVVVFVGALWYSCED
ncbi:hypothetical protein Hamer_G008752 [Homarus americanus]|uniref:Uncharacterized protein n=1 Tax=Homarus americanus TaxID=6706 RepID=A0A8J5MP13_HOMAM|nr:hypothetical protein Hamer_G008752 [Homarus americanus]